MDQEATKTKIKAWLKLHNKSYADLAQVCQVTEMTVRNWMAKKKIPPAKLESILHFMQGTNKPSAENIQLQSPNVTDLYSQFKAIVKAIQIAHPDLSLHQTVYAVLGELAIR